MSTLQLQKISVETQAKMIMAKTQVKKSPWIPPLMSYRIMTQNVRNVCTSGTTLTSAV